MLLSFYFIKTIRVKNTSQAVQGITFTFGFSVFFVLVFHNIGTYETVKNDSGAIVVYSEPCELSQNIVKAPSIG